MTTEQPNEQWLDEILSKDRLTDVYSRNEQVIMVSGDLSSATPLKSAILKHTRSVEAIEKMLGSKIIPILEDLVVHTANEYGGFDGFDEDADDGSRDGINKALAEIRAALGLGEQDV